MKKEYEKCIEKVDNEKMKEALIQAFDKDFPRIIELCDDDYTVVQIFVSLSEMLGEVPKVGMENVSFEKYVIGKAFPDLSLIHISACIRRNQTNKGSKSGI